MVARIELDKQAREGLGRLLARRMKDELDLEVAPFDAMDLVDFLAEALAPHVYNQALDDAQALLQARLETITDAISDLQKPIKR